MLDVVYNENVVPLWSSDYEVANSIFLRQIFSLCLPVLCDMIQTVY
jgi:hypothetical protein